METYRLTLRLRSATRTPWQADTLFGHLCWQLLYDEGEAALQELLAACRDGTPPFVLSNGFPRDWLPRPLLPPAPRAAAGSKEALVRGMEEAKAGKQIRWVRVAEFEGLRRGEAVTLGPREMPTQVRTVLKNQINRLTGGTTGFDEDEAGSGHLYAVDEFSFEADGAARGCDVVVYARVVNDVWAARVHRLFEGVAAGGYGARKSAGYGHFEVADWERYGLFDAPLPSANGFVSLSNWVPAQSDPTDGRYTTLVKYGKLGEGLAVSENPFKFPLLMLVAGSTFWTGAVPRPWYGRLVEKVAPHFQDEVVHGGYALAVPVVLADVPAAGGG